MRFKEILKENKNKQVAVVGWGRGMGHSGHMLLAQAVIEYAAAIGGTPFFFVSETQGEDDPLTPREKLSIYKKVFPKHKNIFKTSDTITAVAGDVHAAGYTRMVLVVGEDQKKSFGFLSRSSGPDRIPVTVASRQDVAKKLGNDALAAEGPRATPMRNILKSDATTEEKFQAWREAMPNALTDVQVMKVMKLAADRMQVPIEDELKEADQPPQGSLYSPLSATTRDRPAPDPRAALKRKRAEASMQRFMGRRD